MITKEAIRFQDFSLAWTRLRDLSAIKKASILSLVTASNCSNRQTANMTSVSEWSVRKDEKVQKICKVDMPSPVRYTNNRTRK